MERAVKKKMKYDFTHFLMISKSYKLPSSGKGSQQDSRTFANAEEELFLKVGTLVNVHHKLTMNFKLILSTKLQIVKLYR